MVEEIHNTHEQLSDSEILIRRIYFYLFRYPQIRGLISTPEIDRSFFRSLCSSLHIDTVTPEIVIKRANDIGLNVPGVSIKCFKIMQLSKKTHC